MRKPFETALVDYDILHHGDEVGVLVLRFPVGDRVVFQIEDKGYLVCLDEETIKEPDPDYPHLEKWFYKCWVSDNIDELIKHAKANPFNPDRDPANDHLYY